MPVHYENGVATAPETVVTAKMTPQAKRRLAQRQTAAFNQARARGDRYFYFDGDWYNTKKKGESDAYWAKHFKDNTTGGGSANVQTSVGGTWKGKQGVEGCYDDNGKWMTFSNNSNSGPVEARGNNHSNARGYIKADLPTDEIITKSGTDRGKQTTNTRTGITVGSPIQLTEEERQNNTNNTSNINWDAADLVDALMPTNAVVNLISKGWNKLTGGTYEPFISKSGFNPFGYAKDASNGNVLGLGLRGFDAWSTLGAPGFGTIIEAPATATQKLLPATQKLLPAKINYLPNSQLTRQSINNILKTRIAIKPNPYPFFGANLAIQANE